MDLLYSLRRAVGDHPALGRAAIRAIPDMRWTVDVRGIGPMVISLRRNRSYWLRDPLTHEGFMLGALRRLIDPGAVVFDVGANIGMYVRFMLCRFNAARVVAFEPMRENLPLLQRNIHRGGCADRVQVMNVALADYDGSDAFQIDDMSSASGTLDVVAQGAAAQGRRQYGLPPKVETVAVARLDTLVDNGTVPVPHVIKLDVEGAEARVLAGAAGTLQRHSPSLVIEMHGAPAARAVVRLLHQAGYRAFGLLGLPGQPRSYREVLPADVDLIEGEYALHHCVAGRDAERLATPPDMTI